MVVKTMAELVVEGKTAEVLFWVGSAGSYDERAKKITKAFVKILNHANVLFGVLGTEETSTGDTAKRSGNEFLFQMQAMMNIEVLNGYKVKTIVTCDPHSFNTLKNEYPELGGSYKVYHHTQFIQLLVEQGRLDIDDKLLRNKRLTYQDPCYLGRANKVYETPRSLIKKLGVRMSEMKRNRSTSLCCGAGGAQMFKEPEKGDMDINELRTYDAIKTNPQIIATACPYCNTMLSDGVKFKHREDILVKDLAELIAEANKL